ncbi:MAG: hypothetical protein PHV16_01570 [Candidatus Nanoarchaeia archaeon]|nr:hypothetical protein [Candidatus Nanoarchaeia archaeon]
MDKNTKTLSLDNYLEGKVIEKNMGNGFVHMKVKSKDNFLHPIDIETRNPIYVNNTIKQGCDVLYCDYGLFTKCGEQYIKVCPD